MAKKKKSSSRDRKILDIASRQYRRLVRELKTKKAKLTQENQLIQALGKKILSRVKAIRSKAKKS